ncbi:MAG: TerD family protein [Cytophagales bacterium]|nr:MAG: TerD family protein [Cytophagales bacterium]TAF59540.1 MAG: TerD family protein [Cytophagales bacterium]
MSISLKKGNTIDLSKDHPSLHKIVVGLGWEVPAHHVVDLDVSAFLLTKQGKMPSDKHFVFYNNLKSPDGAVTHTGDNRTGYGPDDDEVLLVNLNKVDSEVQEIIIVLSIDEAHTKQHHFGMLNNAFLRIYDVEAHKEILRYDVDERNPHHVSLVFGKLYRVGLAWHFEAVGHGSSSGLQSYISQYS